MLAFAFRGAVRLCPTRVRLARALSAAGGGDVGSSVSFFKQASANSIGRTTRVDAFRGGGGLICVEPRLGKEGAFKPGAILRLGGAVGDTDAGSGGGNGGGAAAVAAEVCVLFARDGLHSCVLLPSGAGGGGGGGALLEEEEEGQEPLFASASGIDVFGTGRVLELPQGQGAGASGEEAAASSNGDSDVLGRVTDCWGNPVGAIADGGVRSGVAAGAAVGAAAVPNGGGEGSEATAAAAAEEVFGGVPPQGARAKIRHALHSGVTAVDALSPLGRGQSMLLVGNPGTGKTTVALDTLSALAREAAAAGARGGGGGGSGGRGGDGPECVGSSSSSSRSSCSSCGGVTWGRGGLPVRCIYAALGGGEGGAAEEAALLAAITARGLAPHTTVVRRGAGDAGGDDSGAHGAVAAASAMAMAHRCAANGADALVVLDGLQASHVGLWRGGGRRKVSSASGAAADDDDDADDGRLFDALEENARAVDRAELRKFYSDLVQRAAKLSSAPSAFGGSGGGSAVGVPAAAGGGSGSGSGSEQAPLAYLDDGTGGSVSLLVLWDQDGAPQMTSSTAGEQAALQKGADADADAAAAAAEEGGGRSFGETDLVLFREGKERARVAFLLARGVNVDAAALRKVGIAVPELEEAAVAEGAGSGEPLSFAAAVHAATAAAAAAAGGAAGPGGGTTMTAADRAAADNAQRMQHSEEIKSLCDGHIVFDASLAAPSMTHGQQGGRWPAIDFRNSLTRVGMGAEESRRRSNDGMTDATRASGGGAAGKFKFKADGSERGGDRSGGGDGSDGGSGGGSGGGGLGADSERLAPGVGFGGDEWEGAAGTAVGDPRPPAMRALAGQLRLRLAVAHEMARDHTGAVASAMESFGGRAADRELANETMRLRAMEAVLSQPAGAPLSISEQVVALFAVGHADLVRLMGVQSAAAAAAAGAEAGAAAAQDPLDALRGGRDSPLLEHFRATPDSMALLREIDGDMQLTPERTKRLELLLRVFFQLWAAGAAGR
jgi:hypothetical protein